MKAAMTTTLLSSYFWIFISSCLMTFTQSTHCPYTKFIPYQCKLLPQSDKTLKFPCIVQNSVGCQGSKEQVPPNDLQLNTVHLVSINIYNITYQDEYYSNEIFPALNYTISLPNGDMLQSCQAVRVNIWNNETNGNYGGDGICRLFDFDISTLNKKKIQPPYISDKCFTVTTAKNYFLKFTTLPYSTEIIYSITIKDSSILAVAPVHHSMAISIILGVPVTNRCKNHFYLTRATENINLTTATEKIKFSTNNSVLFENLQPGFFKVRVNSSCLPSGQSIESEIILLKHTSEPGSLFNGNIIWIILSLVPTIVLIICLYQYFLRKQKCIDRSHKCVIDLLYAANMKTDVIVAGHLKKLMEEEFEWCVNTVQVDNFMTCSCEMPTNDVALYLTTSDMHGRVMLPHHYKIIQDIHTSENQGNVIKALLYYTQQNSSHQIWVDFHPSFDIVKDVKKLFYFVYRATKSKSQAELFYETHYPNVNYIEKLEFWDRFVNFIENIAELNNIDQNACSISARLTVSDDDDDDDDDRKYPLQS